MRNVTLTFFTNQMFQGLARILLIVRLMIAQPGMILKDIKI